MSTRISELEETVDRTDRIPDRMDRAERVDKNDYNYPVSVSAPTVQTKTRETLVRGKWKKECRRHIETFASVLLGLYIPLDTLAQGPAQRLFAFGEKPVRALLIVICIVVVRMFLHYMTD